MRQNEGFFAGLGAGGRAWVGFDTTTANYAGQTEAALSSKVKWELNPSNAGAAAAHLGYSFGQAWTLPINVPAATAGASSTQWVTVMGNGYASPSGAAALLVLNPATGAVWHTVVLEPPSQSAPNGLSSPRPVYDAQGRVKALYAGDLRGNVWKITVAGSHPAAWSVSKLYAGSPAQPITTQPEVDYAPNGVHYQVLVGTGKLMHVGDRASTAQQYFLAIADTGQTSPTVAANLATVQLTRVGNTVKISQRDAANGYGYKVRLPQAGDRALSSPIIYRDVLYFSSFNPQSVSTTTDPCADNATRSESIVYALDPRTGNDPPRSNGYPTPQQVGAVVDAGLGGFALVRSAASLPNPDGSVTVNPNAVGGSCFVLVNKLNGTSHTLPMKCPSPQAVRRQRCAMRLGCHICAGRLWRTRDWWIRRKRKAESGKRKLFWPRRKS